MRSSPLTLPGLLAASVEAADGAFLLWGDAEWLSFPRLALDARRLAGGLVERGLGRGERVALLMDNRPEMVVAILAVALAGGVSVPVNTLLTAGEIGYVVTHAGARFLLTETRHLATVVGADWSGGLDLVAAAPGRGGADDGPDPGGAATSWAALPGEPVPLEGHGVAPDDLAVLQYTSGTTAFPKGVMLTHRALLTACEARGRHLGYDASDVLLVVTPLFHLNAQAMSLIGLGRGCRVVLRERFSASRFWSDVQRHRVTSFNGMLTIPSILLARPAEPDERPNPLRTVVADLPPELHRRFEQRFGTTVVPVYGLTEDPMPVLGPAAGMAGREDRLATCGRPVDAEVHRVRILGERGEELPAGRIGEIVKRSPALMLGYWRDPEATADALRDGWLHTGDLGWVDDDGFLYFAGRRKDAIRRGGEMIAAAEVEAALAVHPAVAAAAVVGVPDDIRGEEVLAHLVLAPGLAWCPALAEELVAHCRGRLAGFKVPRYLRVHDELPRTATLKVAKAALRGVEALDGAWDRDRAAGERPRKAAAG